MGAIIHQGTQLTIKPDVYDVLLGKFKPSACPLFNRLKRLGDSPDATLFNWQADARDTPTNAGSAEGRRFAQSNGVTYGARGLCYGRMHHHKEEFGVGEVSQGNNVFGTGGKKEMEYQMDNALLKTMDSAEYTIVGGQEAAAGSNSAAFVTRGLERLIVATGGIAVQTDTATVISAAFRPAAAQIVDLDVASTTSDDYDLTEDMINAPFESVYNALKAKIDLDVFCTTGFKRRVSKFGLLTPTVTDMTVVRRFNQDAKDMKVTAVVETYVGDCGTARFDLHPWMRTSTSTQATEAFGLDLSYGGLRMRKPPSVKKLPDQAAGEEGYTETTFGLQLTPKYQAAWRRVVV